MPCLFTERLTSILIFSQLPQLVIVRLFTIMIETNKMVSFGLKETNNINICKNFKLYDYIIIKLKIYYNNNKFFSL